MLIKSKGNKDKKTWMHPSRKKILDVMHGRESGNATVGWDKAKEKKEVGDRWFDSNGKEWEQHEGFKIAVTQYDEARAYLDTLNTCKSKECKTGNPKGANLRFIKQSGYCINCLVDREAKLRLEGVYKNYEYWKMNSKALGTIKDDLAKFEQARKDADTVPTIVNEDGSIEKWSIDGDIEKVKRDLDSDIIGLNELIITFQAAVDEDWEIIKEKYNEIFND
jgi:hypothetical protein